MPAAAKVEPFTVVLVAHGEGLLPGAAGEQSPALAASPGAWGIAGA